MVGQRVLRGKVVLLMSGVLSGEVGGEAERRGSRDLICEGLDVMPKATKTPMR